ncbi:MAG: 3-keto-disaccharide hydrolase, partial [Thermoguttaceae bacterium]
MTMKSPLGETLFRRLLALLLALGCAGTAASAQPVGEDWSPLFDGKSLQGWKASENPQTWRVEEGCLVAAGERSHLFYEGPVSNHDFQNFELMAEVRCQKGTNSGIYFHTQYQESGWPDRGYEVQLNNSHTGSGGYKEWKQTGSLYGVRNVYRSPVADGQWFSVRILVAGRRVCVWVNDHPTVDYLQPETPPRSAATAG